MESTGSRRTCMDQSELDAPYSYVSDITNGCQIGYRYFDMTNSTRLKIETRFAKGKIQILDQPDGKVIAEKALNEGNEWTETERSCVTVIAILLSGCAGGQCVKHQL